jgi:hypothetical protein
MWGDCKLTIVYWWSWWGVSLAARSVIGRDKNLPMAGVVAEDQEIDRRGYGWKKVKGLAR